MSDGVKEFLEEVHSRVKYDNGFYKKLEKWRIDWTFKTVEGNDHSEFLSSNLIGVNRIIFSSRDDELLLKNVFGTSIGKVKDEVNKLDIPKNWNVARNPVYLTLVSAMHLVYKNVSNKNLQIDLVSCLFKIYCYKAMSSTLNYYCKFQTNPALAKAVVENMSNKFILKSEGSWDKLVTYCCKYVLPKDKSAGRDEDGFCYNKLLDLDLDNLIYVTANLQTRIREIIINIYSVLMEAYNNKEVIGNRSLNKTDGETGDESIGDITGNNVKYSQYLKSIINSEYDFVDQRLIHLMKNMTPNLDKEKFEEFLITISNSPYSNDPKDDYIDAIMSCSFTYLISRGITDNYNGQLYNCLKYLKGLWNAGNIKDPIAKNVKQQVYETVMEVFETTNKNLIPSITVCFLLYLFAKAIKG